MRTRFGWLLRRWADRVDPTNAARALGWSFTFERGRGLVFNQGGRGCQVWYLSDADYARAHDEAVVR